jgi:hypothetical protein
LPENTTAIKWIATILDAADGTGDGIIELPEELLKQLGWEIGDVLVWGSDCFVPGRGVLKNHEKLIATWEVGQLTAKRSATSESQKIANIYIVLRIYCHRTGE